ncbi:MAG: hypothetical protein IMZ43_05330, partial [Thermoplasmata archaeon]|nr:hypothetical protein [Thermoplasmata archaeon]
ETGNIVDSTSHGLNAVNTGTSTESNGKIDGARYFDNTADNYNFGNDARLNPGVGSWTISFWAKVSDMANSAVLRKYQSTASYDLSFYNNGAFFRVVAGGSTAYRYWSTNWRDGGWHLVTAVLNRGTNALNVYLDGVLNNGISSGSVAGMNIVNTGNLLLRCGSNGRVDELRIETTVRDSCWLSTCYNNQNNPSGFYGVSNEQNAPGEPVVLNEIPQNGATNVPMNLPQLLFTLQDYQDDPLSYTVETSPSIGSASAVGVFDGTYSVPISGLTEFTTYTWYVNVTDGTHWTHEMFTFTTGLSSILITDVYPAHEAIDIPLTPTLQLTVQHTDGYQMNITWKAKIDDTWSTIGINTSVGNDTYYCSNTLWANAYSTVYDWKVDVNDGHGNWYNKTFSFTTGEEINLPPIQDDPLLVSEFGTNTTDEKLICSNQSTIDPNGDTVSNTYHWIKNGASLTNLLLSCNTNNDSYVNDYSGYDNTGTITGALWTPDGVIGGAYNFFTSEEEHHYMTVEDDPTLDGDGTWTELTMESWVKVWEDNQQATTILGKWMNNQPGSYQLGFDPDGNSQLFAAVQNTNGLLTTSYSDVSPLVTGTWYHVVATYNNGVLRLYINGALAATASNAGGTIIGSTVPLRIGCRDNADGSGVERFFEGSIDEVKIYPYSLSAEQIHQNYLDSKDGMSSNSTIVPEETEMADTWQCEVTPSDGQLDGITKISNPLTIFYEGNTYSLTITIDDEGSGSVIKNPNKVIYIEGEDVELTAVGNPGWIFDSWTGDLISTTNPETITMDGDKSVTAHFVQIEYALSMSVDPVAGGSVAAVPSLPYYYGTMVTLTAIENPGYSFDQWSGDASGSSSVTTVTMTGDKSVTAHFSQDVYTLSISVDPVAGGSVGAVPSPPYYYGDVVTLTATENPGYSFDQWSGDLTGSTNPIDITMTNNKVVTAHFNEPDYNDVLFNSSFDNGNLINVQFQSGNSTGYRFYTAKNNYSTAGFADKHWWFYYSMENVGGKTVTVQLQNLEAADFSGNRWNEIEPVYSYDNTNWERIPLSNVVNDSTTRTFTITVTPTQNKIWIAPLPPYPVWKRDALFTEFSESPYLNVSSLGSTPGGQQLKVATITDPAYNNTNKFKAYAIAQQHAGEVPGSWNAEGMIRFLLSDNTTAQAIRRNYIFKIVPITNVDGVYYGRSRYTPLRSGVQYDLNRWWSYAVTSMPFEVKAIFEDMQAWQPDCFNDLHSTINTEVRSPKEALTYTWDYTNPTVDNFIDKINESGWNQGGWPDTVRGNTGSTYACAQVKTRLGILESISWENPHDELVRYPGQKLTVNDWMNWGKSFPKGVYLYFGDAHGTLTVTTDGSGIVTKDPDSTTYVYGTSVQLTATPDTGWTFSHWAGDLTGSTNPADLTITGDMNVEATFTQNEYTLTTTTSGSGSGTITRDNAGPYHYNNVVLLTAIPSMESEFVDWSGDLVSTTNPDSVTITGNMNVDAQFILLEYTLTTTTSGTGAGTIIRDDAGPYNYNDVVLLTAVPTIGSAFTLWTGDLTGITSPDSVTITGNMNVDAQFTLLEYTLTTTTSGPGTGSITRDDAGPYNYNDVVLLTAVPAIGSAFTAWSGDLVSTTNPDSVTITGNMNVDAQFILLEYTLTTTTSGTGAGTIIRDDAGPYNYNDVVLLTAVPTIGSAFTLWTGDLTGITSPD